MLAAAGVIKGRTVSAYPAVGPEVRVAGDEYADTLVNEAVSDGNLVSSPEWPGHPACLMQFLVVLGTKISG